MKQYAIVDLKGGLGNQIFQIAYALHLQSLGIKAVVDTHFFSSNMQFPRKLELKPSEFGIKNINFKNTRVFDKFGVLFAESDTFNMSQLRKFNRFVGYYQDFKILEYSKHIFQNYLEIGDNFKDKNRVAIHIRKGDYIELQQNLSDKYYKDAINEFLKYNPNSIFDIYTDEDKLDLNSEVFINVDKVYTSKMNSNSIEVMKKISEYSNYIIANSSFSALAAYFSTSKEKKVIYPSPWWRKSSIRIKSIPDNWISIPNIF
tara:strand:+ start:10267 stop:11043 length:777 start_codon:yes stop_codon:yes gene_type:complete